jgi:hypothetical protein
LAINYIHQVDILQGWGHSLTIKPERAGGNPHAPALPLSTLLGLLEASRNKKHNLMPLRPLFFILEMDQP